MLDLRRRSNSRIPHRGSFVNAQQKGDPGVASQGQQAMRPVYGWSRCGHVQALGGSVMMILQAVLVAADLTIELVHQLVDGGVEVFMGLLDEDVASLHVHGNFCSLTTFLFLLLFHREQDVDVNDLVKVSGHPVQLGEYVLTQGRCHFKMVATDSQVHKASFHKDWVQKMGNKRTKGREMSGSGVVA